MIVGFICFSVVIVVLYFIRIQQWRIAWSNKPDELPDPTNLSITTIVCVHNESSRIGPLVKALASQKIPKKNWQHIWVNDHCTDNSIQILRKHPLLCPTIIMDNDKGVGKKIAQKLGVAFAKHKFVSFTDADCWMKESWVFSIASFLNKHNPQLVIAPVKMVAKAGIWGKCMELEFLALQLCTAGAALRNEPFLCNGANLVVEKQSYEACDLKEGYASGDDMFLLGAMKHNKAKILYLKTPQALVTTNAPETFNDYLNQRARWLRKGTGYSDTETIRMGLLIFFANILAPAAIILALIEPFAATLTAALVFGIKLIADSMLLKSGRGFFSISYKPIHVVLFSLFYPYLILLISLRTILKTKKEW